MLKHCFKEGLIEAGCDEAGRGCLAGPVFAAAVILSGDFDHPLLNDSKQMNEANRILMRDIILKESVAWSVAQVNHIEIDSMNILNASIEAMHRAIRLLTIQPDLLLIDGNRFKPCNGIPHQCIIKGDAIYKSIAAASVLAKTFRDDYMLNLHAKFPHYGWNKNKAYATAIHRQAISIYGESPYHRKSFRLKPKQGKFEF